MDKDKLDIVEIRKLLHEDTIQSIVLEEETSSTMDMAKNELENSLLPALFIANSQTKTRGRFHREYFTIEGQGIYMSALLAAQQNSAHLPQHTILAAVALVKAIEKLTDKKPVIKWVNDIYLDGKKICGILAEGINSNQRLSHVILGIGVNFQFAHFPDDISQKAGSLFKMNEVEIPNRNQLIAEIWNEFFYWLQHDYVAEYKKYSFVLGKEVAFEKEGKVYRGKALEINQQGELIVDVGDEILTLFSGEISLAEIDGRIFRKLN